MDHALSLLELLRGHGIALDAVSYTLVLHGLAHRGRADDALALLDHMTGTPHRDTGTGEAGSQHHHHTGGIGRRKQGRSESEARVVWP